MSLITLSTVALLLILIVYLPAQIRLVRGEFVDESGCPVPDWIGFIRAARNSQEQNLEAVSDLPGGQVNFFFLSLFPPTISICQASVRFIFALPSWTL